MALTVAHFQVRSGSLDAGVPGPPSVEAEATTFPHPFCPEDFSSGAKRPPLPAGTRRRLVPVAAAMAMVTVLALLTGSVVAQPMLDVDFDKAPPGTLSAARAALPHQWVVNMATEVFTIAEDFPHPPKHRPGLRRALRYSGEGGWPAGDLYVVWPEAATAGCLEARALVYLPDERVPVFVGLTRLNPADWQDTGPAAVMLSKRNQACWQGGSFLATCRPGWNHVRLVADLDRRLAYAFARQEDRPDEEMLAWEAPIAVEGKDLRANALYLRTDLGYSPGNAYFADLRVQPCAPPTAPPLSLAADLSHVSPPNAAEDLSGIWDFLPVKAGDASTAEPPSLPPDDARWLRIIVPAEHDPLMRAHDVNRAWFRRTIKVPAAWQAKLLGDVIGPETGLQVSVVKLRLGGL